MSNDTRIFCGLMMLTVPTIAYGGYFLLKIIFKRTHAEFTSFQQAMFRAGHAHAGVLLLLALIAQILIDDVSLPGKFILLIRHAFPVSIILISGGFFAAAAGKDRTVPNKFISLLYAGMVTLFVSVIVLGIGLIRNNSRL